MKRRITQQLQQWKKTPGHKPLVILGARQVGKTYAINEFGKTQYDTTAYIDFSENPNAKAIFDGPIDPRIIIPKLESLLSLKITPGNTLIVFDEIQTCERALTALKYFQQCAPEYDVIAAGSLLGVKVNRSKYSFPVGKVNFLNLTPMDFEEYLWARGEERLADDIRDAFENSPENKFWAHDKAMDLFREYLLIGGMPDPVDMFVKTGSIVEAKDVQTDILTAYTADMAKYASPRETQRILEAWSSVPTQLAKENRKFQYKRIRQGGRANMYRGALAWLVSAGIITRLTRVSEGVAPLRMFEDLDAFKVYMADTGLLTNEYGAMWEDLEPSDDKAAPFRGAINENYVLQQLTAKNVQSYYWGLPNRGEVEFVVRDEQGDVIPIEVKSGKNVTARSLTAYRSKYNPKYVFRISAKNFGVEGDFHSIPLYAAWALADHLMKRQGGGASR